MATPRDLVHFVGSVPLRDCAEVFRALSGELGPYVRRLPDGETGERSRWIYFQREMLEAHPAMEVDPTIPPRRFLDWAGKLLRTTELLRIKPEIDQGTVSFPTGYDEAALASWEVFREMRAEGAIPAGTRFQVSLPTPNSSGYMYVSPAGRPAYRQPTSAPCWPPFAGSSMASLPPTSPSSGTSARRSWCSSNTSPAPRPTTRQ